VTRPTPIPVYVPLSLNSCAAVVDDETGEHLGWVLPDTPERAPLEVREGVTVRRLAMLSGQCRGCGAPFLWGHWRRRCRAAAGGRAPASVPHVQHRPTCPEGQVLDEAIARWQNGGDQ
jgi:hypothetical protein